MKKLFLLSIACAALIACDKNTDKPDNGIAGDYVLAVTPAASTGVADYLLTASDLNQGTITTKGQGIEQDGSYRYYVATNHKFFSLLYGQGNPGAVTTYTIIDGRLNKLSNFQTETVQAFAPVNDDLLLLKIPRSISNPLANFYIVNTNSMLIAAEGTLDVQKVANNGETAFFSWIKQVGNKVYAPYFSMKGDGADTWGTAYPDSAWVAVYSYPEMQLEKVIKDDRSSFIGRYFTDGLAVDEQGDVYAFSSAVATTNNKLSTTKPSSITRIKAGTTEFDKSYLFDVEAATSGLSITDWVYAGAGNFVVLMNNKSEKSAFAAGKRVGVVNVYNKSFKAVSGLPAVDDIKSITTNNYSAQDGLAYIGFAMKDALSYVYRIDASSATATQGLRVEGGSITAISKVN